MRLRKYLISCVTSLVIGTGFIVPWLDADARSQEASECASSLDTIPLPALSYSLKAGVDTLILPDNSKAWDTFFRELDSLRAGKDTVISVVQLGDSHIQAGHLSGQVMRQLQQSFGNAGRGWIAPFKLGRSNEPDDYFIKSVAKEWLTGRCIQNTRKTPVGIGGIGVQSPSPSINLDISIAPNNGVGYSFNQAILYRGAKSMPMLPAGETKEFAKVSRAAEECFPGVIADTFHVNRLTDTLLLHSTRREPGTDRLLLSASFANLYYGFSLTNGKPGILYHSIGVNGAMYVNYTEEAYVRQLALLKPSLLIISLGTNETFGRNFTSNELSGQIESFVSLVKKVMPNTAILLTTPPECYKRVRVNKKRTFVRNENTERAAKVIRQVARKEGAACWDLFATTGGKNSSRKWYEARLMGVDRVHFTKEGYREQGTLLSRALISAYNDYIVDGK